MYSKVIRLLSVILAVFLISCGEKEDGSRSYPSLDTKPVTAIDANGATFNAEILVAGTAGISDHGFVYDDTPNPQVEFSDAISLGEATTKGAYSTLANRNLLKGKTYYVKAYAFTKNKEFVVYGQQVKFESLGGSTPEFKDFFPKQGLIGDTVAFIGANFSTVASNNSIMFSSRYAKVFKASPDTLWCTVPATAAPGENEVAIVVGQITIKHPTKFVLKAPSISGVTPTAVASGDTLTITGTNFPLQTALVETTIFQRRQLVVSTSRTQIKAIVPPDPAVTEAAVTVTTGTQTVTSSEKIKLLKPIITTFSPTLGTGGTVVTIQGNYFNPIPANNAVSINGIKLAVSECSRTMVKVKIPAGIQPGLYPFSITVSTQSAVSTGQFEIIKPTITLVNPLTGTWGTTVTITGTHFGTALTDNKVSFGSIQATVVSASPTEIKVVVPQNVLTKASNISVQVIPVDNISLIYSAPFVLDAPVINSFTPDKGKHKEQVTLTGNNFNPVAGNQIVTFGNIKTTVLSATPTQLVVQLPSSLIDSDVYIKIELAEQSALSSTQFHMISPWRQVANFPSNARTGAVAFNIGNTGYVGLGSKTSAFSKNEMWKYDVATDTWSAVANFAYPSRNGSGAYVGLSAFVLSGMAYVGAGTIGGYPQPPEDGFSKYNPGTNTWTAIAAYASYPNETIESAVGYAINGYGYITSGRTYKSPPDFKLMRYDPLNNTWTRKADFAGPARMQATGFTINNKAYLTTGYSNSGTYYNDLWAYDPSLDKWEQRASLPGTGRWRATAFALNGVGYILGGSSEYDVYYSILKDMWMYDATTDTWTRLDDFPGAARYGAVAFVVGSKAYFGTGGGKDVQTDFWEFDPSKL